LDGAKSKCSACPTNYYQREENQEKCDECSPGMFQNYEGKVFCEQNPPGSFMVAQKSGPTAVSKCPAGKFSSIDSKGVCEECEHGKVQPKEGRSVCDQCSANEHIRIDDSTGKPDRRTCLGCPSVGVTCDGTDKKYAGGTWHDVSIANPDSSTLMYVCVTDGCPEEGESAMQCKEGYQGPMCAVCSDGYFVKVRRCVRCSAPQWGLFFGCIAGIGFVMLCIVYSSMSYRRYLKLTQAFSHFKVFVGFVTVMSTVSTQFGIVWPTTFARALDGLSVLSFDFGVLAGIFCLVQIKFYHSLLISTGTLFVVCVGIMIVAKVRTVNSAHGKAIWNNSLFVAVYIALFAYPVVSVKIVQLFACHEIVYSAASDAPIMGNISSAARRSTPPTKTFLRADYSAECYTPEWNIMAVYAGVWIAIYVVSSRLQVKCKCNI
jgi:hypothetical protein